MMYYSPDLTANTKGWPQFLQRRNNADFMSTREAILQRDNFTCQFCGFKAQKMQEIVNLNHDYYDNMDTNLATACTFCMQCQFLGTVPFGKIIYMPEFSQAEINHLVRIIFCVIVTNSENPEANIAKALYRSLRNRIQPVEAFFGEDTSDTVVFGQSLLDAEQVSPEQRQEALQDLRLLPMRSSVPKQIQYWSRIVLVKFDAMRVAFERIHYE